jgi:acyl dehydratase
MAKGSMTEQQSVSHALAVGDTFSREMTIDAASIRQYATLAGDHNPMHHDESVAKASRFGGLIASGTHTSAVLMGALASYISGRVPSLGLGFSVRLRRAVRAGEAVSIRWKIVSIEPSQSLKGDLVVAEGELVNEAGEVAVSATSQSIIGYGEPGTGASRR